jgi:hypothetical protein
MNLKTSIFPQTVYRVVCLMELAVFSLKCELSICMSCLIIMVYKRLKLVEHDSLYLNKYQFMKKDSERIDMLHKALYARTF